MERRLRQRRQDARVRLRLAADAALLANHHASEVPRELVMVSSAEVVALRREVAELRELVAGLRKDSGLSSKGKDMGEDKGNDIRSEKPVEFCDSVAVEKVVVSPLVEKTAEAPQKKAAMPVDPQAKSKSVAAKNTVHFTSRAHSKDEHLEWSAKKTEGFILLDNSEGDPNGVCPRCKKVVGTDLLCMRMYLNGKIDMLVCCEKCCRRLS